MKPDELNQRQRCIKPVSVNQSNQYQTPDLIFDCGNTSRLIVMLISYSFGQ